MSLYALVVSSLAVGVGFVFLFRRLMAARKNDLNPAAWLEQFSLESYGPLERLVNDERDFQFLASQPGYRPEIERELRRERRAIFGEYLQRLNVDFHQLLTVAKVMMVYGPESRSPFGSSLLRCELSFGLALAWARFRLALYPLTQRWDSRPALGQLASLYHEVIAGRSLA